MRQQLNLTIPEALLAAQHVAAEFHIADSKGIKRLPVPTIFIDGPAPYMRIADDERERLLEYLIRLFFLVENDELAAARTQLMNKLRGE